MDSWKRFDETSLPKKEDFYSKLNMEDFSECLYRRDLHQIEILGGNWLFRWGWFFLGGTWKLRAKNSKYTSKKKKKNDPNCNCYNFLLLVPCPNKFVVVCIYIFIFHGIYSPLSTNISSCRGLIFFCFFCFCLYLVARGWEYFKLLGNLLYCGVLISLLGEGA